MLRFSLRGLIISITLVCLYFGCWHLTERYGISESVKVGSETFNCETVVEDVHVPMPFVICRDEIDIILPSFDLRLTDDMRTAVVRPVRRYYVWVAYCIVRVPYERRNQP